MEATALRVPARSAAAPRDSFYLGLSLAMAATAFLGFSFTYFMPLFAGRYPDVSPLVHVHGWSFFAWYVLLPVQAGLVRIRRVGTHRVLGTASLALGFVMVVVGFIVSAVQADLAQRPGANPFWELMGLPIFTIWILFTVFYGAAMLRRRDRFAHRQFIVLASAVALSAATFRLVVRAAGFSPLTAIGGCLVPLLFVVAGGLHEYRRRRRVARIYALGGVAMLVLIVGAFGLSLSPGHGIIEGAVGWLGSSVRPLYLAP